MSFTTWASAFTDNVSTISAAFLNQIRVDVGRAVDGNGGTYTPTADIAINGAGGGGLSSNNCTGLTMAVAGTSTPAIVFSAASSSFYPAANGKKEMISLPTSSAMLTRVYGNNLTSEAGFAFTINADWDEAGRQYSKDSATDAAEFAFKNTGTLFLRYRSTAGTPFAEATWDEELTIRATDIPVAGTPGANTLFPTNVTKAWGSVATGGGSPTLNDGFNVSAVAYSGGTDVLVTLHTAMADTNYAVTISGNDTNSTAYYWGIRTKTTTTFIIRATDATGSAVDLDATTLTCGFMVMGRQ